MLETHNIYAESPLGGGSTISVDASAVVGVTSMYGEVITLASSPRLLEQCQTEQGCTLFTVVVYVFVQGTMFVLGFIGNTLSFLVLRTDRKSHAATFLLQAMAVIDNLFLLATGFTQMFTAITLFTDQQNHWLSVYLQVFLWPFVHITQLCTVWITVLIAFNRFIAICYPYRADRICSLNLVRIQVVVMVAIVALYNLPRFFEYSLTCETFEVRLRGNDDYDFNTTTISLSGVDAEPMLCSRVDCETALKKYDWYKLGYENVLYCLVVFMLPLLLLVIFNVALVVELFRSHKERLNNSGGRPSVTSETDERHERNNITLVMLVIIVVFLVTQTPAYINQLLYYFLHENEYQCGRAYFYYFHVSNLIVSSNSCLNFVIYCVCRRQFRQRLGDLRCFGRRCSQCTCCRCMRGQRESVSSAGRSSGTVCTSSYTPMRCGNGRSSSCAV